MLNAQLPAAAPQLPVIVGGLVWHTVQQDAPVTPADGVLSGPALGAALGAAAGGAPVRLMVAVPEVANGTALRLLRALDPEAAFWCRLPLVPLRWHAPAIVGTGRRWQIEGDPRAWSATAPAAALAGAILALPNAPPAAYAAMLEGAQPRFTAIDLDARWAPSQPAAFAACARRAQLLTLTRADQLSLPRGTFAGSRAGERGGPVMVVKDGADGVDILAGGGRLHLPAPVCNGPVRTDAGAGDLLLGFLAARLGPLTAPPTLDDCAGAYLAALPLLSRLLGSGSLVDFADAQLGLRREACDAS